MSSSWHGHDFHRIPLCTPDDVPSVSCARCSYVVTFKDARAGDAQAFRVTSKSTALRGDDVDNLDRQWRDQLPTCEEVLMERTKPSATGT